LLTHLLEGVGRAVPGEKFNAQAQPVGPDGGLDPCILGK